MSSEDREDSHPEDLVEPDDALPQITVAQLPETLQAAISRAGWGKLMPVQAKAMPYMLAGRDLMIQSRTGSGKTGAFVLPILERAERGGGKQGPRGQPPIGSPVERGQGPDPGRAGAVAFALGPGRDNAAAPDCAGKPPPQKPRTPGANDQILGTGGHAHVHNRCPLFAALVAR